MAINEFALDLTDSDEFQACRSGDSIYVRRPTYYGDDNWHEVFTKTDAEGLVSGETLDKFGWVEINSAPGKEGYIYTRARESHTYPAGSFMRLFASTNYGLTWFLLGNVIGSGSLYNVGGIWAGRVTGNIMYASANYGAGGHGRVLYSTTGGASWTYKAELAASLWMPRVMIDPANEIISYAGMGINGPNLAKATTTSGSYSKIEDDAGIAIFYGYGGGWMADGNYVRTIRVSNLHFSNDGGITWDDNAVSDVGHGAVFERAMWGDDARPHWMGVASRSSITEPFVNYHLLKSTQDNGGAWYDKAGANADTADTGGGDSIPYNCGGVAENGVYLTLPTILGHIYTSDVQMGALPTAGTVYADGVQMGAVATGSTVYAHGVEQENPRP